MRELGNIQKGREQLNKTIRVYRILLRISLTLMLLLFVKSLATQLPRPAIDSLSAYVLLKFSLVAYLYCWFFGCNRDLSVQNDVLRDAPKPKRNEVGLAVVIVGGFAFLFYVEDPGLLSTVFLGFLAVNVCGWLYLRRLMRPFSKEASNSYRRSRDTVGEVKVSLYEDYLFGRWQWWRFGAGFVLLLVLAVSAFSLIPKPLWLPRDVEFSLLTFLTLSVLEVWIWYKRLKLKIQWDGLDWLSERGFIRDVGESGAAGGPSA